MIASAQRSRRARVERLAALSTAAILLAALILGAPARAETDESIAQEFTASIERFNARDPQSPDTLNARLAYADFLTKQADGNCRAHLNTAREQLDLVTASPAQSLAVPAGLAHAAGIDFQIHLGNASCDANAEMRDRELRAALESAKHAADLYRDEFDAEATATTQFNVAMTYHSLGESAAALSALQATLDLDREYGFDDDAEDNYQLYLQWSGQPSHPEDVEARMQGFPQRSVTLNFAWTEDQTTITQQGDSTQLSGGESSRIQSSRSARRSVRKGFGTWIVSYQPGDVGIVLERLASKDGLIQGAATTLARLLTSLHDFSVARNGDYDDSKSYFKFGARVRADSKKAKSQIASLGAGAKTLTRRLDAAIRNAMKADALEGQIAENYNLETGTWIGAELEQGVWYPMTASLSLPFASGVFVTHKMEFAYSRNVPCTPQSAADSCVEILLRAAPDPAMMKAVLAELARSAQMPRNQLPQLWSVTEMRLITDPKTLQAYRREMRRHSYWSSGAQGSDDSLLESATTIEALSP
jgi:tetratricopeptide (TPR) repeat protein